MKALAEENGTGPIPEQMFSKGLNDALDESRRTPDQGKELAQEISIAMRDEKLVQQ